MITPAAPAAVAFAAFSEKVLSPLSMRTTLPDVPAGEAAARPGDAGVGPARDDHVPVAEQAGGPLAAPQGRGAVGAVQEADAGGGAGHGLVPGRTRGTHRRPMLPAPAGTRK